MLLYLFLAVTCASLSMVFLKEFAVSRRTYLMVVSALTYAIAFYMLWKIFEIGEEFTQTYVYYKLGTILVGIGLGIFLYRTPITAQLIFAVCLIMLSIFLI